jgi:hypothetical protein
VDAPCGSAQKIILFLRDFSTSSFRGERSESYDAQLRI